MSVNTTSNKISYTGDGTTTVFPYNFKILDAVHLIVYVGGQQLAYLAGYSVTGVGGDAGGGVVFTSAPASGAAVLFQRIVPLTQPVSTVDNATILSSVFDKALDRLTMQMQQNAAAIAGAVVTPVADPALDMSLPPQATRANNYFYFDANGEPTVLPSVTSGYYYGALSTDPATRPDGSARTAGDLYFNTTSLVMRVFTGSAWQNGLASAALTLVNYREVAASAKTTFTIAGGYTLGSTFVYLNGALLDTSEYTASNGTTVVLNTACAINDEFRCVSYSNFTVADTMSRSNNLGDLPSVSTAQTNLGMSAFFKTLLASASAAAMRVLLGLGWGATAAKATTVQAQAGTDDTTVMTPLMTAAALTALVPPGITKGAVKTASGTVVDYLSVIPSTAKRITVAVNGLTSSVAGIPTIRVGSGGAISSSGYAASVGIVGAGTGAGSDTTGFTQVHAAVSPMSFVATLVNQTGNTWIAAGNGQYGGNTTTFTFGNVTLAGVLDSLRITTLTGATFTGGTVSVTWE